MSYEIADEMLKLKSKEDEYVAMMGDELKDLADDLDHLASLKDV